MGIDEFLSLRKLLEQLKTRIDDSICERMTDSTPMRTIDHLEAVAVKYIGQVDAVIGLAESYMPDMIDDELIREIGSDNALTLADVWLIIDNLHTHFMDNSAPDSTLKMLSSWMRQLEEVDDELPPM